MTNQELRRDIKKLYQNVMQATYEPVSTWEERLPSFRREFSRLYGADKDFGAANVESLKRMVWLNYKLQGSHTFGYAIEL